MIFLHIKKKEIRCVGARERRERKKVRGRERERRERGRKKEKKGEEVQVIASYEYISTYAVDKFTLTTLGA